MHEHEIEKQLYPERQAYTNTKLLITQLCRMNSVVNFTSRFVTSDYKTCLKQGLQQDI